MIRLENFKVNDHGQVLRCGNEKMILLIEGRPFAAVIYGTLFVTEFHHRSTPAQFLLDTIEKFAELYRWAYRIRTNSREAIDNLTISF